jgi:uncharacterized protein YutE (UPF0331/DUF86 family)
VTRGDIAAKAAFVREALEALEGVPQTSIDEFHSDPRNLAASLHWLQTAIQALVDIGLIVSSTRGLPAPHTSADVLSGLESAGALPSGTADRYLPIIGFRNRIVHLYDRLDSSIVYRIVTEDRRDLVALLDLLLAADTSA